MGPDRAKLVHHHCLVFSWVRRGGCARETVKEGEGWQNGEVRDIAREG